MKVEKELKNSYDPNAMVGLMPEFAEIPKHLHEEVISESKGREAEQRVKDVVDDTVGRVPANLRNLFWQWLSQGEITKVTCSATGNPTISETPPSHQSYQRNKAGADRRGGGTIISCSYSLHCWE